MRQLTPEERAALVAQFERWGAAGGRVFLAGELVPLSAADFVAAALNDQRVDLWRRRGDGTTAEWLNVQVRP